MRPSTARVTLGLAIGLALGGCAPSAPEGPVAVYDAHGLHYESNVLEGVVHISDGCMRVRWQGDDVVLLFPADEVSWDEEKAAFSYAGREYRDGDAISLEAIVHFGRHSGSVPESCPPSVRVYVLEAGLT